MSDRKRMGRRERARMKHAERRHAHERAVARGNRRERARGHRLNLLRKVEALGRKEKAENQGTGPRLGLLGRLLGRG